MAQPENLPPALEELTKQFTQFPGVGRKSALRMAMTVMKEPREKVVAFAKALLKVKDDIKACSLCDKVVDLLVQDRAAADGVFVRDPVVFWRHVDLLTAQGEQYLARHFRDGI